MPLQLTLDNIEGSRFDRQVTGSRRSSQRREPPGRRTGVWLGTWRSNLFAERFARSLGYAGGLPSGSSRTTASSLVPLGSRITGSMIPSKFRVAAAYDARLPGV